VSEQAKAHRPEDPEKFRTQKRESARRRTAERTPEEHVAEREKNRIRKARQRARAAAPD
jgi:hypothetical protein